MDEAVENTIKILSVARVMKPKPPIVFTIQSYHPDLTDVSPVLARKAPFLEELVEGSKWVKLDPRVAVERQPDERGMNGPIDAELLGKLLDEY